MPLIDVHAHALPTEYLKSLSIAGIADVDGFPIPAWSEERHLETMDSHGIAASILSISAPGLDFLSGDAARGFARTINEGAAARRERTGGRLGAFALLTLPDVDGALREMEYALETLGLDGIGLLTNVHGVYLGDERFEPLLAEAERRGVVVFTHPVAPRTFHEISVGFPAPAIEYPFDTTRMVLNLLSTGTLRRHPKLALILSHGGGAVPFLAERMATLATAFGQARPLLGLTEAMGQLRNLFYDSTAISSAPALAAYTRFVPPERTLYGSDTPFMPEGSIAPALTALRGPHGLRGAALESLEWRNALSLFPRLASLVL